MVVVLTAVTIFSAGAAGPKVLSGGEKLNDARLGELTTLDGYHPFRGGATKEEWPARSEEIKRRVKVASGIWPLPAKTPLNAAVYGMRDMGDYAIEKVYFESLPGHYVTGSLYRPAGESLERALREVAKKEKGAPKLPAVLCPHGHWKDGRFLDQGSETRLERQVKFALAEGAERFVSAARSPLQARCVQLARMGCIVFHYDMLATADSIQFLSHKISPREHMNSIEEGQWGFASPAAAARLQSSFGLQTYNSVRAVDFLLTLEDVDPERIGVTGASGGGTQTMMLAAVDDRVAAAFPCVMPSTSMQGGCTCENTHLLRIGQGNIDISAATAPRPLGMTAADDWTVELETKGHPDLVNLYKMLGEPGRYEAHFNIHFKHNYNHVSRTQMYGFFNRHFGLGLEEPVLESDFEYLSGDELTVWDVEHPRPSGPETGDTHERSVCGWMTSDAQRQMRPLLNPKDAGSVAKAREVIGGAVDVMIGRNGPALRRDAAAIEHELVAKEDKGAWMEMTGLMRYLSEDEEIPVVSLYPKNWSAKVALWVHRRGKEGMFDKGGSPRAEVMRLLDAGFAVVGADLFLQGESRAAALASNPGFPADESGALLNRDVSAGDEIREGQEWRRSALYTYGYNDALFAQRVHDVMTLAVFIKENPKWDTAELVVIGIEGAGHWVAAANAALSWDSAGKGGEPVVDRVVADIAGFRFAKLSNEWDAGFLPGGAKYGDVEGFLVLSAPAELWLAGAGKAAAGAVQRTYAAAGAEGEASIYEGNPKKKTAAAIDWVLGD